MVPSAPPDIFRMHRALSSTLMSLPSASRLFSVTTLAVVSMTFCPSRYWIRSTLWMPMSDRAPMAALFLSKNQASRSSDQPSGPELPYTLRKVITSPMMPLSSSCLALRCTGSKRMLCPTIRWRLLRSAAATMDSHSASVMAMGFSTSTCLPAYSAAVQISAWLRFSTHIDTASTLGSSTSS